MTEVTKYQCDINENVYDTENIIEVGVRVVSPHCPVRVRERDVHISQDALESADITARLLQGIKFVGANSDGHIIGVMKESVWEPRDSVVVHDTEREFFELLESELWYLRTEGDDE